MVDYWARSALHHASLTMSDDQSYHSSHATTLGLDYDQSQAHHKIHMMREAELTEEEPNAAALYRHQKHQWLGYSPPTSPPKQAVTI